MTYQIEIEFHPLYELVSSMAVFTNPKPYYDLDKKWFQILESKVAFCVRWPRINGIPRSLYRECRILSVSL